MKLFKKFLSVIFGGVMASTFSLSAEEFTVDDLCDPSMIAVDRLHWCIQDGEDNLSTDSKGPLGTSNQVSFERVYNNNEGKYYDDRVIVRGIRIYNDELGMEATPLAFQFLLADENNQATSHGTRLILDVDHYLGNGYGYYYNKDVDNNLYTIAKGYKWDFGAALYEDPEIRYNFYYKNFDGFWEGKITRDADGMIQVDFDNPVIIVNTQNAKETSLCFSWTYLSRGQYGNGGWAYGNWHYRVIDNYHIDFKKYNATLSGKVASYNRTSATTGTFNTPVDHNPFKCNVEFIGSGEFRIINLTENGYSVIPSTVENTSETSAITGGYSTRLKEAWLDGGQVVYKTSGIASNTLQSHKPLYMRMANIYRDNASKKYDFEDVVGEAAVSENLAHRLKDTHWVTDGGTLRTYEKAMSMSLPDFGYVYALDMVLDGNMPVTRYEYSPCYTDNTLDVYEGDVTLDLHHNVDVFGISEDGNTMMVQTTVTPLRNTQYVESYELWMIPKQNVVNVNGGDFAHEDGHSKGLLLSKYTPKPENEAPAKGARAASAAKPFKFFKILDMNTVPTTSLHRKDEYSFYVKANYKPETGLHPTFHNLVHYSEADDIVTGIEEVEGGVQGVSVSTESGAIIVKEVGGSASSVEVYTPAGVTVYRGTESRIEVGAGLYIVRVGSFTTKVVVP